MQKAKYILILVIAHIAHIATGQTSQISGSITEHGTAMEWVTIGLTSDATTLGTTTDRQGNFTITDIPQGSYTLTVRMLGYRPIIRQIQIPQKPTIELKFELEEQYTELTQVVVSGTRTLKKKTDTPVMVNVIDSKALNNVQACNLSEGLRFQPGLRVETDCQTCNYTQLRMNGLGGGYSQILINGRPVFSPLTGLYGMEQLPTNMIDRIEIVRGGGSSLYGSSAIGGTVNIITKVPETNSYQIGYTYQSINALASDHIFNANASVVHEKQNAGASFFLNKRERDWYDHNGDQFSELPSMSNNSFGISSYFKPKKGQKIELSISSLNEHRYGGEMITGAAAHTAQQSEERRHNVLMGTIDYQINFNHGNSSLIAYAASQHTTRTHFTGVAPSDSLSHIQYLLSPPYGHSTAGTVQAGLQLDHRIGHFIVGSNILTLGAEYVVDDVFDQIQSYQYLVDQTTKNLGLFLQSDWQISKKMTLLSGARVDKHNLVQDLIVSPRFSMLYSPKPNTQIRLGWARGFRAPQAFDADLHIAFAGGGISRVTLSPDLIEERSNSFSGSINYDKPTEHMIMGFTLEGFYTKLLNAFYQHPIGEDGFGQRFEKRNGGSASVQGVTLELRANYDKKVQVEAGWTVQESLFGEAVENIEGLGEKRRFLRTPNSYGYATLSLYPAPRLSSTLNLVYTGPMELAHFAGAPEQEIDEYVTSPTFAELSFRMAYLIPVTSTGNQIELSGGVKNIFNAYQSDFDSGKDRDSNYVYGPGAPRTVYMGIKVLFE